MRYYSDSAAYDAANQLIREDNGFINKTVTYTYDAWGNILTKSEYPYTTGTLGTPSDTVVYTYGNSAWGDQLTSYNGETISIYETHDLYSFANVAKDANYYKLLTDYVEAIVLNVKHDKYI